MGKAYGRRFPSPPACGDTDGAVAATVRLGGNVVMPATDTAFGRMAGPTDPQGAAFRVIKLVAAAS